MHNNIPEGDGGHFSRWRPFTAWKALFWVIFAKLFNDLGIQSYIFDHTECEFRPLEFSKSSFYKIWDKELKYFMLGNFEWNVVSI